MMKIASVLLASLCCLPLSITAAYAGTKIDVVASCGADPTGVADSAPGIQTCLSAAATESVIYFPAGRYKIGSTLTIPNHAITLYGDAYVSARLTFTGCGDMVKFALASGGEIFNGGIRDVWLLADGHCAQTGLHIIDGSWMKVENVQISNFNDSTEQSVGIKTNGREGFHIRDARIDANYPIVLAKNAITGPWAYLDADHFHFENLYTTIPGTSQHWHITIEDQVTITNTTIDGQNPMAGGCGILKWVSTTAPIAASYSFKLANIRVEQMVSGCDKPIHIELPTVWPLQNLVLDNLRITIPSPFAGTGIYLRAVQGLTVRDTTYWNPSTQTSPATFIDARGIRYIELQNNRVAVFGEDIKAYDDSATPIALSWKSGPFRGKECCYLSGGTWLRSMDSGILGQ
jgi:hypothetical protein